MGRVREQVDVDYAAEHVSGPLVAALAARGYALRRAGRRRWRFHHPEVAGDSPFASDHELDLRIRDEGPGASTLDFRFRFPAARPAHTADVYEWVIVLRKAVVDGMYRDLVPGVVSPDGSHVVFEGPPPPFYREAVRNRLGVRARHETRVVLLSSVGLVAFGAFFVALFALGLLDVRYVVCGSVLFFGLPLVAGVYYLQFFTSVKYPRAAVPTLRGVRLKFRSREQFVPWDRITGKEAPKGPSYGGFRESRMSWLDDRGRLRTFQVDGALTETIDASRRLAKSIGGPKGKANLLWMVAPGGTPVLASSRRLGEGEMRVRRLRPRYPLEGSLTPVYVSEDVDRSIARSFLEAGEYDAKALREIGAEAVRREYWDLGEAACRRLLAASPADADAVMNLAGCLLKQGKHREAIDLLDGFVAAHGPSAGIHVMLSVVAGAMGDDALARRELGRAVEVDPDDLDALTMWFDYVVSFGGVGQAVAELDAIAATHADRWGPPLALGTRLSDVGDRRLADKYLGMALDRRVNDATVALYIRHLYAGREVVRTIEVADRVLATPGAELGPDTWFLLADVYKAAGAKDKARQALSRVRVQEGEEGGREIAEGLERRLAEL